MYRQAHMHARACETYARSVQPRVVQRLAHGLAQVSLSSVALRGMVCADPAKSAPLRPPRVPSAAPQHLFSCLLLAGCAATGRLEPLPRRPLTPRRAFVRAPPISNSRCCCSPLTFWRAACAASPLRCGYNGTCEVKPENLHGGPRITRLLLFRTVHYG